jgi:hypothetical protein
LVKFTIQTSNPKTHIEACSVVDYFRCNILKEKMGNQEDAFYAEFLLESSEECFEILSAFPGISVFMDPGNTLR